MKRLPCLLAIIVLVGAAVQAQRAQPDDGEVLNGVYSSRFFDFKFTYPKGWVVQGWETDKRIRQTAKERASSAGALTESQSESLLEKTFSLLTLSEHELSTTAQRNSILQVVAEDVRDAPEITDGSTYLKTIRPLTEKLGARFLTEQPIKVMVGGRDFFRVDYELKRGDQTFHQAMVVGFNKGFVVGSIFTSIDRASVDHLMKSLESVTFGGKAPPEL